ncbi:MAG: hypothetical protein ACREHD_18645 [Pirellulales bacterium]
MTIEKLQAVLHASPFQPFRIYMADGRSVHVPHRDFISYAPSGRTVIVEHQDDTHSVLDLLLMTELKIGNGRASRTRKPKGAA